MSNLWRRLALAGLGAALRLIHPLIPKDPKLWIFGSLDGQRFVDNPKYLFLHLLRKRPAVRTVWLGRRREAVAEARAAGGRAFHNLSIRGIWTVLRGGQLVVSTKRSDVLFFFPAPRRRVFTLHHGMPIKKILYDYDGPLRREADRPLLDRLWTLLVVGFRWTDVSAVICTSPFYREILRSAFRTDRVFVTGEPRTDAFAVADHDAIRRRFGLGTSYVVSYLPTHRAFGYGSLSPIPFAASREKIEMLRERHIQVAYKFHPSALAAGSCPPPAGTEDVLVDLSHRCQDPQELLAVTDCLITDYSSVFIDFLLLDRPVLFYLYDEEEYLSADNPAYFRIRDRPAGPIVADEEGLFEAVLAAHAGEDPGATARHQRLAEFHAFRDFGSSERVWQILDRIRRGEEPDA
jgi:CDP-glycerol glycerophosphotransferase